MKKTTGWETFLVVYQTPAFGTDGLYSKELKRMLVSTQGGISDAKAACTKYHPGCRVVVAIDRLSVLGGLETRLISEALDLLR